MDAELLTPDDEAKAADDAFRKARSAWDDDGTLMPPGLTCDGWDDLPEDVRRGIAEDLRRTARRDELRRERWGEGGREGMTRLARSFPSLQSAIGIDPWDAMAFARGAFGGWQTGGSRHAVRFVLQVWNSQADWRKVAVEEGWCSARSAKNEHYPLAPFNVVAALGVWDQKHVAAFLAWCEAPFFP